MTRTSTFNGSDFGQHVLKFLGKDYEKIFLPIEPTPASRPRVSKWGTYYGKNYERFRREVRDYLHDVGGTKLEGPLVVFLEFVVTPPKTTKRDTPRGDVDNYAKGPLDSLTSHGGFWDDDDQIVSLGIHKRFKTEDEEAGVHIYYAKAR
jgi:Holliday junction resolvase RusA-like endonuclease